MAEVKLASYLRKRASVLNMMKALEAFCESYDSKEIDEVPIRLELVEQCKVDYKDIMSKIEELDLEKTEESINYVQENAEFFTRFCKVKGFLLVQTKQDSSVMNTTLFGSTMCVSKDVSPHLRLPKVDLPTFNGNSTSWLSFRDRFTSMIHSSSDIPPVLKLQYLLSSLKGEAASHFEHTNITADNYAITWNALLKQYDYERMLIRGYYRALHFLPSMKSESVDELSQLVDDFVRHVKGLERLKEPIAKWDTPLTNMLFFKLDDATLLAWETYSASNSRDTYGVLIEFLQERIKILKSRIRHGETAGCSKVAGVSNKPKLCGFRSKFVRGGGFAAACTQQGVKRCSACEEQHELYQCASFEKMSVRDRSNLVSKFKLCFNCLKPNHTSRLCASRFKCHHCGKAHHTLLCFNVEKPTRQGPVATVTTVENEEQPTELPLSQVNHTHCATKTVFLSTAVVYVLDKNGVKLPARALIDSGAQINLITERLVQQLRLPRNAVHVPISGVGSTASNEKSKVTTKIKSSRSSYECVLDLLVLPKLVPRLPSVTVDTQSWNIPCNIQLADPQFNVASDVDIILGAEVFFNLIIGGQISLASNMPLLVNSHLGWIVSGTYTSGNLVPAPICASTCYAEEKTLSEIMQAFFRIEEVQDDRKWSGEELECEEHFMKTTTRDEHGRYIVRLPCKDNMQLGDSRQNALRRFNSLEKRLIREPNIKMDYVESMEEYIRLEHMTLVKESEPNDEREFYLPHHPVFKLDSTTTKCRVVFDASCKSSNGVSLNDVLKVGQSL